MRVIICGSRIIKDMQHLKDAIAACPFTITEVISGGAEGVDSLAIEWAKENGIDYIIIPANWKGKGKAAGYKRNQKMVWYASLFEKYDLLDGEEVPEKLKGGCLAVWDGKSTGTNHTINISKEENLPIYIHVVENVEKKKPGRKPKV